MMKILCLFVLIANIFLLMWEYRGGAFATHKKNPEQQVIKGKEQILLLRELKKETQVLLPKISQETEMDAHKPDSPIKQTPNSLERTDTATMKQPGFPQVKSP
jgi:hypothetical protein